MPDPELSYLPTPPLGQDMTQGQFFKRSLTGLNSEFSFSYTSCLTKAEEPNLSYYLPIAGGGIFGFIPFPRVLVLCEMQSVRSRIRTRVAVFISRDDNHYTTGTSLIRNYEWCELLLWKGWFVHQSSLVRLSSCWVTLRPAVLCTARFWSSGLHHWRQPWSQGAPPGFSPLRRDWVYRLVPEARLFRGMPTGHEVFLKMPGAWRLRPAPGPTLKSPCDILVRLVGRKTNISK